MPRREPTAERTRLVFRLDEHDPESGINFRTARADEIDKASDKHGFPSRSAFLRVMVQLGMNYISENGLMEIQHNHEGTEEIDATTIRELVPEGEENAVDIRDELLTIIEQEMIDIVDSDPEINRNGWEVYR